MRGAAGWFSFASTRCACAAALFLASLGCTEEPGVTSYEMTAVESRKSPPEAGEVAATLDHMLAAIIPAEKDAWFFKLVTSPKQADAIRQPFRDFVATVDVAKIDGHPAWTLPAGWIEKPGSELRAATIEIPAEGKPLEIAVSTLPINGTWDDFIKVNVDRWFDQLQQAHLRRETILNLAQTIPAVGRDATMFELVGVMQAPRGMMPPGHPPIAAGAGPSSSTKTDSSPMPPLDEAATSSIDSGAAEFDYVLPKGWSALASDPMRKATFAVDAEGERGEVAVTAFPAVASMADPVENARRWAAQVGAPVDDASLRAAIEEAKVGSSTAQIMKFVGPEGPAARGIAAAMVRRGDQVWFFKFSGPRGVIESQDAGFRELLKSVKFRD